MKNGFIIPIAIIVLSIAGILIFGLHAVSTQRNRTAHRYSNLKVADYLADCGLEMISTRISETAAFSFYDNDDKDLLRGNLLSFFLQSKDDLLRYGDMDSADFHLWAQGVFGNEYRAILDIIVKQNPGSSVDIFMKITPVPLLKEPMMDIAEKLINLTFTIKATYHSVTSEISIVQQLKVYNTLAPLGSKFTLYVDEASPAGAYNILQADPKGMPLPSNPMSPFICYNTPQSVTSDYELTEANISDVQAKTPFNNNDDVRNSLDKRGYIYMGTNGGDVMLNLTAGESLDDNLNQAIENEAGQFFHFANPVTRNSVPAHYIKMDSTDFFKNSYPAPLPETVNQKPYLTDLFWAYHHPYPDGSNSLRSQDIFGSALETENSSILHLFGNDNEPSRTRVYGSVYQQLLRFSYLAIDRDESNADENIQVSNYNSSGGAPGYFIPIRETVDPPFRYVSTESLFFSELAREAAGQAFERLIAPFPVMSNNNFFADINSDGVRQVSDPFEPIIDPQHATVSIDPAIYTYANMFNSNYGEGTSEGYHGAMSQKMTFPYNHINDYMIYSQTIPPEKHPAYPGPVVGGEIEDYLEPPEQTILFKDPLHETLGSNEYFKGDLQSFFEGGYLEEALTARVSYIFEDEGEFYRMFLHIPDDPEELPVLSCNTSVLIKNGSLSIPHCIFNGKALVILADGDITSSGIDSGTVPSLTLATLDGDIYLTGPYRHDGQFIAAKGQLVCSGGPAVICGNVMVRSLTPSAIAPGGSLRFSSTSDPTTNLIPTQSYIDYYHVNASDIFLRFDRKSGQ